MKSDSTLVSPAATAATAISILLVDDSPSFLGILARFLGEQFADEVIILGTALGGEEALTKFQALRPDVVVLDLVMPGLSGLETIPRLCRLSREVGIVAMTLWGTDAYRQAAYAAGADAFVSKDALATDLLPAIRRAKDCHRGGGR